jgi:hypothetical protein
MGMVTRKEMQLHEHCWRGEQYKEQKRNFGEEIIMFF